MDTPANDNTDPWSSIGWQAELILNRLRQIQKMKDWLDQRPNQAIENPNENPERSPETGSEDGKRKGVGDNATAA